ncbi:MAG: DNA gyrase inhibitor YacG [Gammaproteobacteria bacterium]|nr:DNA gyrase inhibitor YacG [Gammaproteobacteria bacterium]MCW8986316.1 DNA gyrase inhibitor YacG [Gammaproteobacteria bacterium]MCW9031312.1 DNA gyrase inhibitor YacG [Gammaproteobacteria bacterium]
MNTIVKCPACQKQVEWSELSAFRPFCSERCRLIDLGDWASEKHAIADETIPTTEEFPFSSSEDIDSF